MRGPLQRFPAHRKPVKRFGRKKLPDVLPPAIRYAQEGFLVSEIFASSVGGGQAVLRDFAAGVNYGASDPPKDGAAIPQLLKTR